MSCWLASLKLMMRRLFLAMCFPLDLLLFLAGLAQLTMGRLTTLLQLPALLQLLAAGCPHTNNPQPAAVSVPQKVVCVARWSHPLLSAPAAHMTGARTA